jgi:hypothetical protein
MDVLNRYQEILEHPTLVRKVLSDSEALKLNEMLFGDFMPDSEYTTGR